MDPDILMGMLGNISQEMSQIKLDIDRIETNTTDVYELNDKLNKIIELLEIIADK